MLACNKTQIAFNPQNHSTSVHPHILVGITHPQTCLTLTGRLRALREAGFRVTLVSSPGELLDRTAAREGAEAIAIPIKRCLAPFADLRVLLCIYRLLRRIQPDVVEFSTPKAGLLGMISSWFCGVQVRIYMLRGLKLEGTEGIKRLILLAAERLASSCAHVVLCNSESLRAQALALGIAPAAKLKLLHGGSSNGVNVERFAPAPKGLPSEVRECLGLPFDAPVIGFVGRLTRDKGIPELIDAFDVILRKQPDAYLLLVGWFDLAEDALGKAVQARIMSHPRILCTGFVADTAPYYRAMDLLVLPSWREGFPNVALEAAATGIPVITTMTTGSRDAVVPEVTGFLIPPGYPEAISEAVLSLLTDPERCFRMGQAARAWVLEHFVDRQVLGLAVAFYKQLLVQSMARNVCLK
jgi:glycosyltransferase involved in cell wall biosynthesis